MSESTWSLQLRLLVQSKLMGTLESKAMGVQAKDHQIPLVESSFFFIIQSTHQKNWEHMDGCGAHNNRSDRGRCAIVGMEHSSARVDCWTIDHANLCINHLCFCLLSLQLLPITRSSMRTHQKYLLPGSRPDDFRKEECSSV